jgi:hypothetical protein
MKSVIDTWQNVTKHFSQLYAERHSAKFHFTECHSDKHHFAECHLANCHFADGQPEKHYSNESHCVESHSAELDLAECHSVLHNSSDCHSFYVILVSVILFTVILCVSFC